MPNYYFHLHECGSVTEDDEGHEFPTLEAARAHGLIAARSIMCDELHRGALCLSCHLEITDLTGAIVSVVRFRDAVDITGF